MKNLKAKNWFFLILGVVGLVFFIAISIMFQENWWLGLIGIVPCIVLIATALKPVFQSNAKNTHTVEGTFTSIGKYSEGWVGCYFDVDDKETRIAITNDVYNPKLLMPGGKYKLTRRNKDSAVIGVERID